MTSGAVRAAILVAVAAFAALEAVAMALYPGGTDWDAHTAGYRFWENYLCDLTQRHAIDGAPNVAGARLATAAMLALTLGLVPFWIAVARLAGTRLARAACALGLASVVGTIAVVFLPSDRFGALHGLAVVVAGVPGLGASALGVATLLAHGPRPRVPGAVGVACLAVAFVDFVLYVRHLATHDLGTPVLPAIQKVALALLVAWMVVVAVARAAAGDPRRAPAQTRP